MLPCRVRTKSSARRLIILVFHHYITVQIITVQIITVQIITVQIITVQNITVYNITALHS